MFTPLMRLFLYCKTLTFEVERAKGNFIAENCSDNAKNPKKPSAKRLLFVDFNGAKDIHVKNSVCCCPCLPVSRQK